jgi:hypothetical protein
MQLQHLQLSDAIRLGSLLVDRTEAGNIERCAITMALKAIGALPEDLEDCRSYRGDQGWNQWSTLAYPERTLRDAYPWLEGEFVCGWCPLRLRGEKIVWHPFDYHVMHGVGIICAGQRIPLDEMCNWIASCERRATSIEQATAQI